MKPYAIAIALALATMPGGAWAAKGQVCLMTADKGYRSYVTATCGRDIGSSNPPQYAWVFPGGTSETCFLDSRAHCFVCAGDD